MTIEVNQILDEYVNGLMKLFEKDIKRIILYGSYARGEEENESEKSDIDIMILVDVPEEELKVIQKKVLDFSYDVDLKYDILLSPIVENINNYNSRVRYMQYYKNIEKEGVILNAG
jgi:predicted nucleotidyltransferase